MRRLFVTLKMVHNNKLVCIQQFKLCFSAKQYKDNIVYSPQDATSFFYAFNYKSKPTILQPQQMLKRHLQTAALLNKDFRQANNFCFQSDSLWSSANGQEGATSSSEIA